MYHRSVLQNADLCGIYSTVHFTVKLLWNKHRHVAILGFWLSGIHLDIYVTYSHANVVTSASEQNFNFGDMALYKYIGGLLLLLLTFYHTNIMNILVNSLTLTLLWLSSSRYDFECETVTVTGSSATPWPCRGLGRGLALPKLPSFKFALWLCRLRTVCTVKHPWVYTTVVKNYCGTTGSDLGGIIQQNKTTQTHRTSSRSSRSCWCFCCNFDS